MAYLMVPWLNLRCLFSVFPYNNRLRLMSFYDISVSMSGYFIGATPPTTLLRSFRNFEVLCSLFMYVPVVWIILSFCLNKIVQLGSCRLEDS